MQYKYFAQIEDNKVTQVIVANPDFIAGLGGTWIQTWEDGAQRKNYAGIGHTYDATRDAFIAPKPFNSWLLDEDTCQWKAPIEYPTDGLMYEWDEELTDWKPIIKEIN